MTCTNPEQLHGNKQTYKQTNNQTKKKRYEKETWAGVLIVASVSISRSPPPCCHKRTQIRTSESCHLTSGRGKIRSAHMRVLIVVLSEINQTQNCGWGGTVRLLIRKEFEPEPLGPESVTMQWHHAWGVSYWAKLLVIQGACHSPFHRLH